MLLQNETETMGVKAQLDLCEVFEYLISDVKHYITYQYKPRQQLVIMKPPFVCWQMLF